MSNHEPQYLITESDNPWIPALTRATVYDIYYIDNNHKRYLACAPTRAEAEAFIERDRVKPVWDERGDCRWCGIARSDLSRYPAWWFGCVHAWVAAWQRERVAALLLGRERLRGGARRRGGAKWER